MKDVFGIPHCQYGSSLSPEILLVFVSIQLFFLSLRELLAKRGEKDQYLVWFQRPLFQMPNRRIPPPPPTRASSSNPFSDPPEIAQLPPPQAAFTASQVSSSSTLVDNHSSSSHTRQHTPVSPVNIPSNNVSRFHNTRNRSTGSSTDFQASPRSFVLEGTSPHHVERSNSPFAMTSSPSKEHYRHRRGKSSLDQTQDPAVSSRITESCGPTALSSDYALGVVFAQFENVADKKMELILNMGVVREKREREWIQYWMMLLIMYKRTQKSIFESYLQLVLILLLTSSFDPYHLLLYVNKNKSLMLLCDGEEPRLNH